MPWKECDAMELRTEFCLRAYGQKEPLKLLCQEYGISRKTGYKWLQRYKAQGRQGMTNQSRRPRNSPERCSEQAVCRIVRLKLAHPRWGPLKIHSLYQRGSESGPPAPSLSSVKRILTAANLVQPRKLRKPSEAGAIRYGGSVEAPNDLWTIDFKGWWRVRSGGRFEPLTVRDQASRYILCSRSLSDTKGQTVRQEFEKLFDCYGLPRAIRMDNGSPWANALSPLGLTRLSAWWISLGIDLDRIAPGRPDQNGAHERMHRDMAAEVEQVAQSDPDCQQAALDQWRKEFNEQRPHQALNLRFPCELYTRSSQAYDPTAIQMSYPGMLCRKVTHNGMIGIESLHIPITTALEGYHVGLKSLTGGRYGVWFGKLCLGLLDVTSESFEPADGKSARGALPPSPRDLSPEAQGKVGP